MTKYLLTESVINDHAFVLNISQNAICYTSKYIRNKIDCFLTRNIIHVISLNGDDMESFHNFQKQHNITNTISFNDRIILFLATKNRFRIIVDDGYIEQVCHKINLDCVKKETLNEIIIENNLKTN